MEIPLRNEAKRTKEATEKKVVHPKSMAELQKLKIDKLMKKPDKPVYIPEPKKEWKPREAPEFVRDVMGSSAGAGSGEFHVYRHIRRREFAREQYLNKSEKKHRLDSDFQEKLQANRDKAEQATAKRRAKRLRRKQKLLYHKKKQQKQKGEEEHKDSSDNEDETEENAGDDAEEQSFVMGGK